MLSILLIGVGLSMDAFAVSVTSGLTVKGFGPKHAALLGLYFGGFQFLMPLIGYLLGSTVSSFVSAYAPYISFFLLAFVGVKMLVEAIRGGDKAVCHTQLKHSQLLVMAIATSLDALAVGISFAFMDVPLLASCVMIGCTTFVLCFIGGMVGGKIPRRVLQDRGHRGRRGALRHRHKAPHRGACGLNLEVKHAVSVLS